MATQPILFYNFKDGLAQNSNGSYKGIVLNCIYKPVSPPLNLVMWNSLAHSLLLKGPKSYITLPHASPLQNMGSFTLEMIVRPDKNVIGDMILFSGQTLPVEVILKQINKKYYVEAKIRLVTGWRAVRTKSPIGSNKEVWVSVVYTGDEIVIFINAFPKARCVFQAALLKPIGIKASLIGVGTHSFQKQFKGFFHAIRIYDGIAKHLENGLAAAASQGLGEIESKYWSMGGTQSMLHQPILPEKKKGKGRYREYQGGSIYWSPETGSHAIMGKLRDYYLKVSGVQAKLGFPISDMEKLPVKTPISYVSRFEHGAIYFSQPTGVHAIYGELYADYIQHGAEQTWCRLGLPTSDPMPFDKTGKKIHFSGGTLYRTSNFGCVALHGAIRDYYESLGAKKGYLKRPVGSDQKQKDDHGVVKGWFARFEGGRIHSHVKYGAIALPSSVVFKFIELGGPAGTLGFPVQNMVHHGKYEFYVFERGIIRYDGKKCRALSGIRLRLGFIRSDTINDGLFDDNSAELITYTSVKINGKWIEKKKRRPKTHGHTAFELGSYYPGKTKYIHPVGLDTTIELKVEVYDYDTASKKDYLGTIEKTFTIDDIFDIASKNGMGTLSLKKKGNDVKSLTKIKLEYALQKKELLSPAMAEKVHFRKYHWWAFDNFKTPSLSWKQCAETFIDLDVDRPVFRLAELIFYEAVYKENASGGNCVGMSLEALACLNEESDFAIPLYQYKSLKRKREVENEDLSLQYRHRIERRHGYQYSLAFVLDYLYKIVNKKTELSSKKVFRKIKKYIDTGELPLVNMVNYVLDYSMHTVVAYAYEKGENGKPHKIWVADPNDPWNEKNLKFQNDCTHIKVKPNDYFLYSSPNPNSNKFGTTDLLSDEWIFPNEYFFETPYTLVRGPQISLVAGLDIGAILSMLLVGGNASSEQLEVNGEKQKIKQRGKQRWRQPDAGALTRIPMVSGAGNGKYSNLFVARSQTPKRLKVMLNGTKRGSASAHWVTKNLALSVKIPMTSADQDCISIQDSHTARPEIQLQTKRMKKTAMFDMEVTHDPNANDSWFYRVSLPITKARSTILRRAKHGGELEIEPAVINEAVTISVVNRLGKKQTKKIVCKINKVGEKVVVRPQRNKQRLQHVVVEYRQAKTNQLRLRQIKRVPSSK